MDSGTCAAAALPRVHALRRDLGAGVVLAALLVPQGMAYAELAGVSPVTGVYATLIPLVVYFLLGPSRILVLDRILRCLRSSPRRSSRWRRRGTSRHGSRSPACSRCSSGRSCSPGAGAIRLRDGNSLSMPVRLGYLMGIAVTVIVAQLPKLFGFSVDAESFIPGVRGSSSWNFDRYRRDHAGHRRRIARADPRHAPVRAEGTGCFLAVVGADDGGGCAGASRSGRCGRRRPRCRLLRHARRLV